MEFTWSRRDETSADATETAIGYHHLKMNEFAWTIHGFTDIRGALRIFAFSTRVSRRHGYYVIDGSHTVYRRFWYCGTPRKSAVWATVQNRGGCSTLQSFQCCFFAVICRQQLKLDNTQWLQSEDVDTRFPQSNRTQLLRRCVMELLAVEPQRTAAWTA